MDQFAGAFIDADSVIVLPIYAASEEPIPGVTAERLAEKSLRPTSSSLAIFPPLSPRSRPGPRRRPHPHARAGNVSQLAPQILAALQAA